MALSHLILQEFSLLKCLAQERLIQLGEHMRVREYARRELVFSKNKPGEALYFLIEGRLQALDFTVDGREVGLYFINPGDYFGELAVIDGQLQSEYMIAVAKAKLASLPMQAARELIESERTVANGLLSRLASRLRSVAAQRTLLSLPTPGQRICAQILLLCSQATPAGLFIPNAPTHQEFAIMINTSRETVTRFFQILLSRNTLKRDGTSLVVLDHSYLAAIAEGKIEPPKAA